MANTTNNTAKNNTMDTIIASLSEREIKNLLRPTTSASWTITHFLLTAMPVEFYYYMADGIRENDAYDGIVTTTDSLIHDMHELESWWESHPEDLVEYIRLFLEEHPECIDSLIEMRHKLW